MASTHLLMALAATAELCGTVFTPAAARMLADDLSHYSEPALLAALVRCRRELTGKFNAQAIVDRIEDGRPGAEQAWGVMPRDELASLVWTDEMRAGWVAAKPLIDDGDRIAARMAFKEAYVKAVREAREAAIAVRWTFSPGRDPHERERVLLEAARLGRLSIDYVAGLLPHNGATLAPAIARLLCAPKVITVSAAQPLQAALPVQAAQPLQAALPVQAAQPLQAAQP